MKVFVQDPYKGILKDISIDKLLELALRDYKFALLFSRIPLLNRYIFKELHVEHGLCYYFRKKFNNFTIPNKYVYKFVTQEELDERKPSVRVYYLWYEINTRKGIKQRIDLLNRAIEYYKVNKSTILIRV